MIRCEITVDRNSTHIQQLCTGFVQLHRRGVVRLRQRCQSTPASHGWTGLWARIEDRVVYYDTFDGPAVCEPVLDIVDCYFKRSYSRHLVGNHANVFPLGLNYQVLAPGFDSFRIRRILSLVPAARWPREVLADVLGWTAPASRAFGRPPSTNAPARVVFMTRVWDPVVAGGHGDALEELNQERARIVLLLRRALGPAFVGGIAPDPYALTRFREAVLLDGRAFVQRRYLATLRDCSIGVASRGLWRSIGWKFGEYVSLAKAVVSQPLDYEVPGNLGPDRNYLEFRTPEECVEVVIRLVQDPTLRSQLMTNNHHYYHKFVKPEMLVLNTITKALAIDPIRVPVQ